MNAGGLDLQILVNNYSVELRHGMTGVKAWPNRREAKIRAEIIETAGNGPPLVGVAHEHRRHFVGSPRDGVEDRAHLATPPKAREIKVHADDPDRLLVDQKFGDDCSARLKRR